MDLMPENIERFEFRRILFDLSASPEYSRETSSRVEMYKRLEALYHGKKFRHFYSDVFSVLTQVNQEPERGNINYLVENLDAIRKGYQPKNVDDNNEKIDISLELKKLYDHVNLDVARMAYSDAGDWKISGNEAITSLKQQVDSFSNQIDQMREAQTHVQEQLNEATTMKEELNGLQRKLNSAQKEYITILGIFAAIVLAFTGGIAFSSSVLQNIHRVDIYTIVFVLLIIGIVLVNFLFGLLFYIDRIISHTSDHPTYPLIISNAILILLLVITCIFWWNGWVESRNERIQSQSVAVEQMEDMSTPETSQ